MHWQLAEAKNRLSELMTKALDKGPQFIRRRDEEVVVLSKKKYDLLTGKRKSFTEWLMNGPGLRDLDLTRDPSPGRDFEF